MRHVRGRALLICLIFAAGCGGGGSDELKVSAASSLKPPFTELGGAQFSFAGSDQLAAQIRSGAKPDVFAAANTKLPDALYADGLVEKPVKFAGNRLVLAVAPNSKITKLSDLATPGVAVAMGSPGVPIGAYTEQVLSGLPAAERAAIMHNVRSREPDVAGVIGKLTEGAVDAGFVYVTDVKAAGGKAKAIELPATLEPNVTYEAAVVKGTKEAEKARAFIGALLTGKGAAALRRAGFAPPP
jgi:molybdate transport system substrate-binding protein